ncbi:MAG: hypothetical protein AAB316_13690, partial [Bacteroidota bacterium]
PGSAKRGYGAALTYFGIRKNIASGAASLAYGGFAKLNFSFGDNSPHSVFLNFSQAYSGIFVESGWDRYNALEKYKRYQLARLRKNIMQLGWEFRQVDAGALVQAWVGFVFQSSSLSEVGKQALLETPNHFEIGFAYGGFLQFGTN